MAALTQSLNLPGLLSPDNTTRQTAEAGFRALQESQPALLAMELVSTLGPAHEGALRELSAVLLRRELPSMLGALTADCIGAVKAGLLQAVLEAGGTSLRRKLCDTIGRLGAEFIPTGSWPELMDFIARACASNDVTAHAAALTMLSFMGPALVQHQIWAGCGQHVHALLVAGLAAGAAAPEVTSGALCALTALLRACAEAEGSLPDGQATEKKQIKAVAASLQSALPQMLGVVEQAVNAADAARLTEVLENLLDVAEAQPRLFKPVLPQVVEGMAALAGQPLPVDVRIGCVELLLTLAEGASKMCGKVSGFEGRVLFVLLPMLLRMGEDVSEWEEAEPEDGLNEGDEENEEEKEVAYAAEGIDRLCEAMGGEKVTSLLLPQLQTMVGGDEVPWQSRHAALVAVAQVCGHATSVIEPHLTSLIGLLASCATAANPRLRWATFYCMGLLCDDFASMGDSHATLVPLVTTGMSDGCPRVQAAAALATVNLAHQMEDEALQQYAQPLLGAVHAPMASPGALGFVVYSASCALSQVCSKLGGLMGSAYAAFMPLLRERFVAAMQQKKAKLAGALLEAQGNLVEAAGMAHFAPEAEAILTPLVQLAGEREQLVDDLNAILHSTLAKMAKVTGAQFAPCLQALVPILLEFAKAEPEFQMDRVEKETPEEEEDGFEVNYLPNAGKGLVRLKVNAAQLADKELSLTALYEYASAQGAGFVPFVQDVAAVCVKAVAYRWSETIRASATNALSESYKCVSWSREPEPHAPRPGCPPLPVPPPRCRLCLYRLRAAASACTCAASRASRSIRTLSDCGRCVVLAATEGTAGVTGDQ